MVDYKGPKLLGVGFPLLVNASIDENVPFEDLGLTSSSEVLIVKKFSFILIKIYIKDEGFSDDSPISNFLEEKKSLAYQTSSAGFTDVIEEVNRKIAYSTCTLSTQKNIIKMLVSKQKNRFGFDGFDLDLTCKFINSPNNI